MAEPEIEELYTLIKKWTAAEIMARLGILDIKRAVDFYQTMLNAENEIRKLLYGTDDLLVLGIRWGMLRSEEEQAKIDAIEALKQKKLKLQKELAAMDEDEVL